MSVAMYRQSFVFVLLVSLTFIASLPSTALAEASRALEESNLKGFKLLRNNVDIRDAIMEAAAKAKCNVVIAPEFKGPVLAELGEQEPLKAIRIMAAAHGGTVVSCGPVYLVVPSTRVNPPNLVNLDLPGEKMVTQKGRHVAVSTFFLTVARSSRFHLAVDPSLEMRCSHLLKNVPLTEALRAIAWACGLSWTSLDDVLFVGTATSALQARQAFETRN